MQQTHSPSQKIREQIRAAIDHLAHTLPSQAPIRDFVHHNTLHGYQHLPFPEALATARRLTGARGYLPLERYQAFLRQGRITRDELRHEIDEETALQPELLLAETDQYQLKRSDVYLAAMMMPATIVSGCQLNWQIEENGALQKLNPELPVTARRQLLADAETAGQGTESAAVEHLWQACLAVLNLSYDPTHPEELFDLAPDLAETLLHDLLDGRDNQTSSQSSSQLMEHSAHLRLDEMMAQLGQSKTMRDLLLSLTGEDLLEGIRPQLIRGLGNFLDQGVSSWQAEFTEGGFYHFWRSQAATDPAWQLAGIEGWQQHFELLDNDPLETIISELHRMGLAQEQWSGYLERLALELPGWSGMVLWRHNNPNYESLAAPVEMLDYLAVRLVLERIYAHNLCAQHFNIESSLDMLRWYFRHQFDEFTVREALFNSRLPEYLASRAQRALHAPEQGDALASAKRWNHLAQLIWTWRLSSGQSQGQDRPTLCDGAWPLFQLAQHLGWCGSQVSQLTFDQIGAIFTALDELDEDRQGYIWLKAYEKHYRDNILKALAQNHGRGAWTDRDGAPAAQLIFCMDDREEGIRRHLEEIYPEVETLGAAAHFNVPHNWQGLDDTTAAPLAPVIPAPVIPVHQVCEQPAADLATLGAQHRKRHTLLNQGHQRLLQMTRQGIVLPGLLSALAAPLTLPVLIGKVLVPGLFGRLQQRLKTGFEKDLQTRIDFTAPNESPEATLQAPRLGFTDIEQADRVQTLLKATGLTSGFSPLVMILGHGSRNQNNPHTSAYNCGACSGRFSGPNARLAAAMANRNEVRKLLSERGIEIPAGSWFIGAEHDTCSDQIICYDLDLIPDSLKAAAGQLDQALIQASQRHARERCRRFASAPHNLTDQQAMDHVSGRANDFSQARPELGHATNACAFIGRRSLSRGAFFDRRAFLISYDASTDPQGEVLERHLLINGAVGAGISLEYYFSTVDNENYGSGSKVTHNVTGFLGVMEGASSDLRTGLPRQMIEIHEAMRLLVVVEASTEILTTIYQRQPPLQQLVGNDWVQLVAIDPQSGELKLFNPRQGWIAWQAADERPLTKVDRSEAWYLGSSGALPTALIKTPMEDTADD
ncbi:MAG: DUF2309 domain-containing protein [Candidatus Thiodiazotropha lotti]|nr:DUF2309 domain-containing protein [Candidatus Thiodiazotropha lotti]MCG7993088.1 DUF2309 domain-containing protein [Candidatus Thiodiazotropha lotti]MCG8000222.1 DUF2309 domain-containing protein [Candidatus Thiodiazotropha lotti]MCW4184750.1 DUF2309 domain-containing protein [Candidatus Thiodiazotropha weberae]MCW4191992.1 DUF2309 domain-containing protein [Candidatus Thiodiazotropha weberae]